MAIIRISVTDSGPGDIAELLQAIVDAVRRRLGEELHRLVRTPLVYGATQLRS